MMPNETPPQMGWTHETLLTHVKGLIEWLEKVLEEKDKRYEQRFKDSGTAVDAALNAAKEAVTKAEAASEKRFEGVNEFRETLSDQQRTLMPRAESDLRFSTVESRLAALEKVGSEGRGERRGATNQMGWIAAMVSLVVTLVVLAFTLLRS